MVRPMLLWATLLVLAFGCSQSAPSSPTERAEIELRKGNYGTAIEISSEAAALNPLDEKAFVIRGRSHHFRNQTGDLERAIADFSEAIRLSPNDSEAYYSRSMAYRDHGDADASKIDGDMARKLDPRVTETYSHLPETNDKSITLSPSELEPASTDSPDKPVDSLKSLSENYGEYLRLKRRFDSGSSRNANAVDDRASEPALDSPFAPRMKRPGQANNQPLAKFGENASRSRGDDDHDTGTGFGFRNNDGSMPGRGLDRLSGQTLNDRQAGPPSQAGRGQRAIQGQQTGQPPSMPNPGAEWRPPVQNPFATGNGNPASPWQQRPVQFPAGASPPSQTPFQSPFPQRAPRPTGFVSPLQQVGPTQPFQNPVPSVPPAWLAPDD